MKKTKIAITAAVVILVGSLLLNGLELVQQHIVYLPLVNVPVKTLKSEFAKYGIRFGFAVSSGSFENPITRALIERHASIVTTEVALKMQFTQPERGIYDFTEGDAIVAYADELGIGVYGHTASWSLQNPQWLLDGNFTRYELEQILTSHVSTLSKHYDGRLIGLDAANEGYLGCGPWCPLGTDSYVNLSFESAGRDLLQPMPLIYNSLFPSVDEEDYAIALLDNGVVDGIGIQLHLVASTDWQSHLARIDGFLEKLNGHVEFVRLSEVGVHMHLGEEEAQAEVYAAVTALAIKHKDIVKDFVIWGVKDPAWRGDVTLFDRQGQPKPSYYAVMNELR